MTQESPTDYPIEVLVELGKATVGWSKLEHNLRWFVASLSGLDAHTGEFVLGMQSTENLLQIAEKLVEIKLNGSENHLALCTTWLSNFREAKAKRNLLTHSLWAQIEQDGNYFPVRTKFKATKTGISVTHDTKVEIFIAETLAAIKMTHTAYQSLPALLQDPKIVLDENSQLQNSARTFE